MTSKFYSKLFDNAIQALKDEGRYRVFADLERNVGESPNADFHTATGEIKKVTVWCSNDYLGMSHHPKVVEAMKQELTRHGAGAGGTRNISGTHHTIVQLETEVADLLHKESALCFSSGYVANQTALCTLGTVLKDLVIYSDSENHASMIEGIRHSRAERHIFRHSDCEHLESLLKQHDQNRPALVAFESVYAMDGDRAPLKALTDIAKKYNALTYLDEIHSMGLYGPRGGGLAEEEGLSDAFDCIQGGFGKGFGVVGGFIAGSKALVDVVRSYGSGFIFTTAIPPVIAAGILASIRHLKKSDAERKELFSRVKKVREAMIDARLPILETDTQIIPLMVGDSVLCKKISDTLLQDYNIYIQPINYPTVPRGTERLRITPTPVHTDPMTDHLVHALSEIWGTLNVKPSPTVTSLLPWLDYSNCVNS